MYDFKNTESRIRGFWDENKIFEKSLELRRKGKRFVFWEGPPTANGLPHTGHFLTRLYKDLYGRYKTMRGFFVLRKAGWDTHGLPVEIEVEKELGFTNKKQIEEYLPAGRQASIAFFNRKARESVWKYTKEWEEMTTRMGFWLDMDHPYVTYETNYMESVWSILKTIWDKDLLYRAHKIVSFCVRCGTPLSAHEVSQGYKLVTERSVYLKFKIKNPEKINLQNQNVYILAWTTTPWTLPGNVALAVGPEIRYQAVEKNGEYLIAAIDRLESLGLKDSSIKNEFTGANLIGLEYEPLFDVPELKSETSYKVYLADFVTTADGTGVVHTAVMYGEDDYILGTKLNLPKAHTVTEQGRFIDSLGDGFGGKAIIEYDKKSKATEDLIIEKLQEKNQLFKIEDYEHDYPFCWRCNTPLLYYAKIAWFIRTSALNRELLANNSAVNWVPEHIRDGRFGEWLREARDWTLSRERYWGTPLPIWECSQCDHKITIGSIKELEKSSIGSRNTYYAMRHGGTTRNEAVDSVISTKLAQDKYHLTLEGQANIEKSLQLLQLEGVDLIFTSPFIRTQETAAIAARILHTEVKTDERLREISVGGSHEGKKASESPELNRKRLMNNKLAEDGESFDDVRARMTKFMRELESTYKNKKILIVGHGDPLWLLDAIANGLEGKDILVRENTELEWYPRLAEVKKLDWRKIPRNEYGELDLHRPFIDEVVLKCPQCKSKMRKIPDLIDVWFDSGSMPYAQWHYPFENKKMFKEQFPADFIVEAVDQTRGWFWSLLGISTCLGLGAPYKNVLVLGHALDEKGQKMSKSKGNYVPVMQLMDTYGTDVIRWYFLSTVTSGENKAVIPKEIEDKLKGFFFTFQNCIRFYEMYGDKITNPSNNSGQVYELRTRLPDGQVTNLLDKWLMSRLHRLIRTVTENLDAYEVAVAGRALEQFVIEDLSNWWVRRSRKRKEALPLLRHVLLEVSKLLAPFVPFMAEDAYHRLSGGQTPNSKPQIPKNEAESIHLCDWPKVQKKYINDKLEAEMALAREVIAKGLAERKEKQLKVRQPLASVVIKGGKFGKDIEMLIRDELNVKKINYRKDQEVDVTLDFDLTPELIREGYAREMMRQIQDMRKEAKYKMEDQAVVHWHSFDDEIVAAMAEWAEEIKKDTVLTTFERHRKPARTTEAVQSGGDGLTYDLEKEPELAPSKKIWLGIKK